MTDHHQLRNVRRGPNTIPDDTATPVCHHCGTALHEVPLEGITTRAYKRTYCTAACYQRYINESAAQLVRDHVASPQYQAQQRARSSGPNPAASAIPPRQPKSVARQTAEAGANVVGFLVWLVVISAIAAVIYYFTGIDSTR